MKYYKMSFANNSYVTIYAVSVDGVVWYDHDGKHRSRYSSSEFFQKKSIMRSFGEEIDENSARVLITRLRMQA